MTEERRRASDSPIFEAIQALRGEFMEGHQRLRTDMTNGFAALSTKFELHVKDDQAVENRVLIIETERKGEATQAVKRNALTSLLVSSGMVGAWKLMDRFLK